MKAVFDVDKSTNHNYYGFTKETLVYLTCNDGPPILDIEKNSSVIIFGPHIVINNLRRMNDAHV